MQHQAQSPTVQGQNQSQIPAFNQGPTPAQIQPVSTPAFNSVPTQQVFHADQTAVLSVLQQMMEEILKSNRDGYLKKYSLAAFRWSEWKFVIVMRNDD